MAYNPITDYHNKIKALHGGAATLNRASNTDTLFEQAIEIINLILGYPKARIAIPQDNHLEIIKTTHQITEKETKISLNTSPILKKVLDTKEIQQIKDSITPKHLKKNNTQSTLLVPIIIGNEIQAILIIDHQEKNNFSSKEIEILQILSIHISNALSRIKSNQELAHIEEWNKAIMDQAEDAIILIDFNDEIKFWNPAAKRIFEYDTQEVLGNKFFDLLVPNSQREKYLRNYETMKNKGFSNIPSTMECICINKSGKEFSVDVSHSLVIVHGVPHILRMMRSSKDRRDHEKRLQALYTHISKLATASTEYEIGEITREAASVVFGVNHGSIALKKGDNLEFLMNPEPEKRLKLPISGKGITVRAFNTGKIQLIQDITQDIDYIEDTTTEYEEQTSSELDIPITLDNEIIGVLNVESTKKNRFSEKDVQLMKILAENIAQSLKRLEIDEERKQYQIHLEALHNSTAKLSTVKNKDDLYDFILDIIINVLGFQWTGIAEPQKTGLKYIRTSDPDILPITIPYDAQSITLRAYKSKKSELVQDVTKDPDYLVVKEGIRYASELVVPIIIEEKVVFLINIESIKPINEIHKRLVEIVATHAGSEYERIRIETLIRENEHRLRTIINNAIDAIFMVNQDKVVTLWNKSSEKIYGYNTENAIGKKLEELIIPKDREKQYQNEIQSILEGKINLQGETRESNAIRKNGEEFIMGFTASRVAINGEPHVLFVTRDVTAEKENEEKLQQLNKELQRSNQDLENYTYVVSHDLKAPLRSIRSFSSFLIEDYHDKLGSEAQEYLERIISSVTRMDDLINDLLTISRIGRKFTDIEEINLNTLIQNITLDLEAVIQEKDVEIQVSRLPTIKGQRVWISQLFTNLISNGIKFNKNKPQINITCEPENNGYLFKVSDNGIGISQEYHESIFNLFERLHTVEEYEGTGAGLAICKKIVEGFGGKIWIESQIDQGSTFYFTYPTKINEMTKA